MTNNKIKVGREKQATHALVKDSRLVVVKDGPHGLTRTHAE